MGGGNTKSPKNDVVKIEENKYTETHSYAEFNGNYLVARELGQGAFSVVKLATNKKSNLKVAVKIVSLKELSEEDV